MPGGERVENLNEAITRLRMLIRSFSWTINPVGSSFKIQEVVRCFSPILSSSLTLCYRGGMEGHEEERFTIIEKMK